MPVAVLHSRALTGMHAPEVIVEAHIGSGLPSFTVVGLPEAEVKESRDRVRAAIVNSQFEFPMRRDDRQSGAGRPAQGIRPLRSGDGAGNSCGLRPDSCGSLRRL